MFFSDVNLSHNNNHKTFRHKNINNDDDDDDDV